MEKSDGGAGSPAFKTLIAYGTRYGATAGTSEEIAKILRSEGVEVKVVNLKEEVVEDLKGYDMVVVGSGIPMGKWASEAEDFLERFSSELGQKKLAIFASTMKTMSEREGKIDQVENIRRIALTSKVEQYNLHPVALGLFGGVIDFNKMGFFARTGMRLAKSSFVKDGFKEEPTGVYDLRDWNEIRQWAKELASTMHLKQGGD